jgi:hypothetical protein
MRLFPEFRATSWNGWGNVLARITPEVRELYVIAGRGSGKSRIVALLAAWFASKRYRRVPGENVFVGVFAPDRKQARVTFRYVRGLLRSVPELAALIERETRESLALSNGIIVEIITASTAAPRGRTYALCVVEEAAFLRDEESSNPDVELIRALRPALARCPGSLLAVVSSPYARRGVLWNAVQRHAGQPDGDVVVVQAPTLDLNPLFDAGAIAKAFDDDPISAASEYGAQFRNDLESYVAADVLDAVIVDGRYELPPTPGITYFGWLDFASGTRGGDSAACAIAHPVDRHGRTVAVLDAVREVRPKFSPQAVCADFAALLASFGVTRATADRWATGFTTEEMQRHGITVLPSERNKSQVYAELLSRLNSGDVELLDVPRLRAQFSGLERRTRNGRDSIQAGPGGHDDLSDAASGALLIASEASRGFSDEVAAGIRRMTRAAAGLDEDDDERPVSHLEGFPIQRTWRQRDMF